MRDANEHMIRWLLFDSGLSFYRIGKDTGVPTSNVYRLQQGQAQIENLRFSTASMLTNYARDVQNHMKRGKNMSERLRGFEVAKGFEEAGIELPKRSTEGSAGYDFKACEAVLIPAATVVGDGTVSFTPVRVKTGVKAYFPKNEVLKLPNRSSNPSKRGLVLANGIGIVDSDYYGNSGNDGHIMLEFINISGKDIQINVGDKIGQGLFEPILLTDDDDADGERTGGHGSTDK